MVKAIELLESAKPGSASMEDRRKWRTEAAYLLEAMSKEDWGHITDDLLARLTEAA